MTDAIDRLRTYVEAALEEAGFVVIDIVTHSMDLKDGETEWIASLKEQPGIRRLSLSNNFGELLAENLPRAHKIIAMEVEALKRAKSIWRCNPALDVPD